MKILLNGAWREVPSNEMNPHASSGALTLDRVLVELGFGSSTVATALNGQFVPAPARLEVPVQDGDRLEVLAPMQGG